MDRFSRRAEADMLDETVTESIISQTAIPGIACSIESLHGDVCKMDTQGATKRALTALGHRERDDEQLFRDLHHRVLRECAGKKWRG